MVPSVSDPSTVNPEAPLIVVLEPWDVLRTPITIEPAPTVIAPGSHVVPPALLCVLVGVPSSVIVAPATSMGFKEINALPPVEAVTVKVPDALVMVALQRAVMLWRAPPLSSVISEEYAFPPEAWLSEQVTEFAPLLVH